MSGGISGCHNWGWWGQSTTSIYYMETRDATQHSTVPRTVSHSKELSGPKWLSAKWREPALDKGNLIEAIKMNRNRDFPGTPGAKSPPAKCRGPRSGPWLGN